jgi:antitoxin ParD1/3/4
MFRAYAKPSCAELRDTEDRRVPQRLPSPSRFSVKSERPVGEPFRRPVHGLSPGRAGRGRPPTLPVPACLLVVGIGTIYWYMKRRARAVKHTSVTLGEHFESFIEKQLTTGRFETASEVIRAALRLLEEEESKVAALRAALEEGETSGFRGRYSLERLLGDLNREPS